MKKFFSSICVFIICVALLFIYGPALLRYAEFKYAPYTERVYAVYLDNGQTFFGRISSSSRRLVTLTEVYYFQTLEVNGASTNNLTAQSANQITVPENYMVINRDHIIMIERISERSGLLTLMRRN